MSANATTAAPTGRKKAIGHRSSAIGNPAQPPAALGHDSQIASNPEGAKELPQGWRTARVGDILKVRNGYAFKSTDYKTEGVPLIRQSDLGDDVVDITDAKRVDPRFLCELPGFVVRDGDLLIGMSGSLGKIARYQHPEPALQNQRTGLLQVKPGHETKFAKLVLKFVEPQILAEGKGIAVQNVSASEIEDCTFPLPEPDEQRRIVAEIEKQFTRLEAGVAALRRVQANLKRYRAAVLKAACEGKLVPTEHELSKSKGRRKKDETTSSFLTHTSSLYESGEALLQRILAERRRAWEGNAVSGDTAYKGKLAGDVGRVPSRGVRARGQYKESAAPDTANLPPLPQGWTWATIEHLRVFSLYGPRFSSDDYAEDGYIVLRTTDISESGKVDASKAPRLKLSKEDFERYRAKRGDLLVTRTGSLGTLAIFDDDVKAIPGAYLIQFRLATEPVTTRYLFFLLKSPIGQRYLTGKGAGVGRPNLNAPTIEALPVPLPPLAEQTRIVAEVERRLSVVEELESMVSANLQRATRLRQSILQKAFTGELVAPEIPGEVQLGLEGIASNVIDICDLLKNRAALDAYILINSPYDKYLGRTKMEKENHFAEYEAEIYLGRNAVRDAAGPVDFSSRLAVEEEAKKQNWYSVVKYQRRNGKIRYEYVAGKNIAAAIPIAEKFMGSRKQAVDRLIKLLKLLNTDQCSIIATLYAAWNDLRLLGRADSDSDQAIIKESTDNWHPKKKEISLTDWNWGLNWLRKNNMVPKGRGKLIPTRK